MTPGDRHRQRKENDFRRLKQQIAELWEQLGAEQQSLLRESVEQFTASLLPETASVPQILESLERLGVLSPNSVSLLSQMCDLVDCAEAGRLVQDYLEKHPPSETGLWQRGEHAGSKPPALSRSLSRQHDSEQQLKYSPEWASASSSKLTEARLASGCASSGPQSIWPYLDCEESTSSVRDSKARLSSIRDSKAQLGSVINSGARLSGVKDSEVSPAGVSDWDDVLVLSDSRESSCEDNWWGVQRSESPVGSSSAMPPPLQTTETEESRRRSMALWGHSAPAAPPPAVPAVCECHHPAHRPSSKQPRRHRHPATTVEQALDLTSAGVLSGSGGSRRVMEGVTSAGARRARLVDFLSSQLGPRFHQLGGQMERLSGADLADIACDTSRGVSGQARRLLQLFLSRHRPEDGDAEIALVRRLRRIRFNRLADELELWSEAEDRLEDPRDWSEDKRRWRSAQRHEHPSPVRISRMACC